MFRRHPAHYPRHGAPHRPQPALANYRVATLLVVSLSSFAAVPLAAQALSPTVGPASSGAPAAAPARILEEADGAPVKKSPRPTDEPVAQPGRSVAQPGRSTESTTTSSSPSKSSTPQAEIATADSTGLIFLGAAGAVSTLEQRVGEPLAKHDYADLEGGVPSGSRMITFDSRGTWASVANAQPGSTIHNHIVRWATAIKVRSNPVLLAYSHEPELEGNLDRGTATDFINAYRKVVTVFRQQGVTNVRWTWQMTAWAFRARSDSRVAAAKWYPGDNYIDIVGADAYNWNTCGHGRGRWNSLQSLGDPVIAFAKAHGKKVAFPEFGSDADSRRAAWLDDAHTFMVANRATIAAAFYFNRPPTNPANADCSWPLATAAEFAAYGRIAADAYFTN